MALSRIKSFIDSSIKSVSQPLDRTGSLEPEVGVRIVHSPNDKTLHVTVLGARHLPQNFGFTRVNSYVVKVKLIPGKENRVETSTKNESWPTWNEEFTFKLTKESKLKFGKTKVQEQEINASKVVVATLYAILEDKPLIATDKKETDKDKQSSATAGKTKNAKKDNPNQGTASGSQEPQKNKLLSQFFGKSSGDVKGAELAAPPEKKSAEKRRVIGAATIALDPRIFGGKPPKAKHTTDVSTGDLWKVLKPISSGIVGSEERRENKKGQVELTLCQEKSDRKDVSGGNLTLTLNRLRCSLQSMHEHEALKGQLYLKMSVVEGGRVTRFWKSDRFAPCMSLKFDIASAKVTAENHYDGALKGVSFVVKLVSKTKMGKKVTLGHLVISEDAGGNYSEQWKMAFARPGYQVTKWQAFE